MRRLLLSSALFVIAVVSILPSSIQAQNAPPVAPDARTPQQVVEHHLDAFTRHDVEAVLSDYADDAIFLASKQTVQGKVALRRMFESFLANRGSKTPTPAFEAKVTSDGDVGYEHWVTNPGQPGSMEGTDVFVVRHGKILFHTVLSVGPAAAKK
jgi:ketosteroid isomerase-like protein